MAVDRRDNGRPESAAVQPADVAPVAEDYGHDVSDPSKTHRTIIENARAAAAKEQGMTLWQGIKLYPKAVGWSVLISTCIAMEGYDISLVNNFCEFNQCPSWVITTLTLPTSRRISPVYQEVWRISAKVWNLRSYCAVASGSE